MERIIIVVFYQDLQQQSWVSCGVVNPCAIRIFKRIVAVFFCIGWQKSSPCKFFASFFFRCWNFSSSCLWPQLSRTFSASRDSRFSSLRSFFEKQLSQAMEQIIIVAFWSGVAAAKSFLRRCNSFCAIRFYKLLMTGCCVGRRRGGEDCLHNAERETRGWKDSRLRKTEGGGKRECSGIGWHWTFWKSNEQVEQLLAELVLSLCFEPSAAGAPFGNVLTNPWFMEVWGRGAFTLWALNC